MRMYEVYAESETLQLAHVCVFRGIKSEEIQKEVSEYRNTI